MARATQTSTTTRKRVSVSIKPKSPSIARAKAFPSSSNTVICRFCGQGRVPANWYGRKKKK